VLTGEPPQAIYFRFGLCGVTPLCNSGCGGRCRICPRDGSWLITRRPIKVAVANAMVYGLWCGAAILL